MEHIPDISEIKIPDLPPEFDPIQPSTPPESHMVPKQPVQQSGWPEPLESQVPQGPLGQQMQMGPCPVSLPSRSRRQQKHSAFPGWHGYFQPYVDAFARYGVLTKEQLSLLTGHTPSTVRTVLQALTREGYAVHHRVGGHVLYYLTPKALPLTPYAPFARKSKDVFGLAQHDFVMNEIVTNAIKQSQPPIYGVLKWMGPMEAREHLAMYYGFEQTERSKKLNYVPDAYFELYLSLDNRHALLPIVAEVDRGTESPARVLYKLETGIRTLLLHRDSSHYNLIWFVVDHRSRFDHLLKLMSERYRDLEIELTGAQNRMPKVFLQFVKTEVLGGINLFKSPGVPLGDRKQLDGKPLEQRRLLNDFLGVSVVHDPITQEKKVRTQIPSLLKKMAGTSK